MQPTWLNGSALRNKASFQMLYFGVTPGGTTEVVPTVPNDERRYYVWLNGKEVVNDN